MLAYVLRHLDANDELLRLSPSRQALRDSREGTIVEFLIFDGTDDGSTVVNANSTPTEPPRIYTSHTMHPSTQRCLIMTSSAPQRR
jgi:hypothetical protein